MKKRLIIRVLCLLCLPAVGIAFMACTDFVLITSPAGKADGGLTAAENNTLARGVSAVATCQQIKDKLNRACEVAGRLREFTWDGLSLIGWSSPLPGTCAIAPQGYTYRDSDRWTPLADMLPARGSSDSLASSCGRCLEMADAACAGNWLSAVWPASSASENVSPALKKKAYSSLKSALSAAQFSAFDRSVIVRNAVFKPVEKHFAASDVEIVDAYYSKYREKSELFIKMQEEVASCLWEAEQLVTILAEGESPSGK